MSYEKYDSFGNIVWNYGIKLKEEQIKQLIPLINAFDYEPYRDRKQSLDFSDGFIGYRDEYWMDFVGITDIPIFIPEAGCGQCPRLLAILQIIKSLNRISSKWINYY
jgi:hypothetical protein